MERTSEAVVLFLFNALWQLTLLAVVASVCARVMRSASARYAHALWALTLALCCALPLWSVLEAGAGGEQVRAVLASVGGAEAGAAAGEGWGPLAFYEAVGRGLGEWARELGGKIIFAPQVAEALLYGYLLIICHRAFVLWRAWRRTRAIRRSAYARELSAPLVRALAESGRVLGVEGAKVLCSREAATPLTIGALRPVVILPESFFEDEREEVLAAVLGHELAHVRRRDYLLNLLFEFLYAPVAFHPAAALVKRRLNETRELACDEMVVAGRLLDARSYARTLVEVAAASIPHRQTNYSLGIGETCNLEERIMKLMRTKRHAGARAGKLLLAAGSLVLLLAATGAAAFSFAAQDGKAIGERAVVGTWNVELPNGVAVATFVFKSDAGKLSGHFTGYDYNQKIDPDKPVDKSTLKVAHTTEADIGDIKLEAGKLTFSFNVKPPPGGPEKLTFNAEITFDSETTGDLKVVISDDRGRELRAKVVKQK